MTQKLYIAGPMTGLPQFNFPAFDALAKDLRHTMIDPFEPPIVITPSELDDPAARAAALASPDGDPVEYARLTGLSWGDFLSRDVKLIADGGFTGIVTLPNWQKSRGARLETFVGHMSGIPILSVQRTYDQRIMLVQHGMLTLYRAWCKDDRIEVRAA